MYKGIIFDMDGVIINSEPLHYKAWVEVLARYGVKIEKEEFKRFVGIPCEKIRDYYLSKQEYTIRPDVLNEKQEHYKVIEQQELALMPGVKSLLDELIDKHVPIAIASSSKHLDIRRCLKITGALEYFHIICSGTDVAHTKPEPDLFLYTAKKMNLIPAECIVIEDSVWGIMGAKKAGMHVCAYTSSHEKGVLLQAGADYVFDTFEKFNTDYINKLSYDNEVKR
jgi:HAD superfamily hydrolase (TIGR01509 family)